MTHEQLHNFVSEKGEREFNPQDTLGVLTHNRNLTYWSWGVSKLINMFNKGLCMKVSGHHHKGWVIITLGWTDTYSVYIVKNNGEIKSEHHLVYVDELTERIDTLIERIPKYVR